MNDCPRCGGWSRRVLLRDGETMRCWASDCLMCGWVFNEATIDAHHGALEPPPPRPAVTTPVWDPSNHKLVWDTRRGGFTWRRVAPRPSDQDEDPGCAPGWEYHAL